MRFVRTGNAGVWVELDGVSVLLDGVSKEICPYIATPQAVRAALLASPPTVAAFTHLHEDHYDAAYAAAYAGKLLMPETVEDTTVGNVHICTVPTRHLGKADVLHCSYVLDGSCSLWFMGDASPDALKQFENFSAPDVLFAPFAFALTASAWRKAKQTGAKKIVVLHLPDRNNDPDRLWDAVLQVTQSDACIPEIGEMFEV